MRLKMQSLHPGIIVASLLGLGLMGIILTFFQVNVSFEQTQPEISSIPTTKDTPVIAATPVKKMAYSQVTALGVAHEGGLRVSNQTDQPLRVAVLMRQASASVPAHWDFAPQEGSEKGLALSLPNSNLKLQKGDILVAFAQGSSRRYWGPYIVGETPLPQWNPQTSEWLFIIK